MSGVTILYGSETGNAEDYARYLAIQLRYLDLHPVLSSLDDYPLKSLVTDTKYLIVICSTSGQGDLPRNAQKFMKFILKRKLPNDLFNHIQLSTLGLGDSSYSRYNYAIRKLHARLTQLGCSELSTRCEADEMSPQGVDGYYQEWESQLITQLKKNLPWVQIDDGFVFPPKHVVSEQYGQPGDTELLSGDAAYLARATGDIKIGTIVQNKRITSTDHFQDVRHVIIESTSLEFSPGDCAALYPTNDSVSVDLLLQLQSHWLEIADKPLIIRGINLDVSLRTLLTQYLDLLAIPSRSFFKQLWHFVDTATDAGVRECERLQEFASFEEPEELYDYANRPRRLVLETLLEFENNLKIPLSQVYDLFPKIKPRLFSIASKPSQTSLELVVGIVEYKTMIRRIRKGLCSKWLKLVDEGDHIIFSISRSHIQLDPQAPLILIAPGTGIAPMKSLLEMRNEAEAPETHLFFGCRFKEKDFLFGDIWESMAGVKFYPCFSRDIGTKYKYVQDRLYLEYSVLGDLILNKNATVFVCGLSGKMPKQVKITFVEIVKKALDVSEEESGKIVQSLEDQGRYIEDTW